MTALVIGLGSMGRRRIRLVKQHYPKVSIYGVDQSESRREEVYGERGIASFSSVADALACHSFDCAFVCTSPLSHADIIETCLSERIHVFTELNLVTTKYMQNAELASQNNLVLFLSSTFLYRDETKYIIKRVNETKTKLAYTYHIGQYLPDWHPWENYQDYFVGNNKTSGCREILAIELPWLLSAFGKIKRMMVQKTKISDLSIDYPDCFSIVFEHEAGHQGQLLVDVVSRVPIRHFEVIGEFMQMEWRGTPEQLWQADSSFNGMQHVVLSGNTSREAGYADFVVEDAYLEEIKMFFSLCNGERFDVYGFEEDMYVLGLIDRIEE